MKIKKVLIALCITTVSLLGISNVKALNYTNYYGIEMTIQEYRNLLNLGFTEDTIYYMDLNTFNENKDLNATLLAREVKYLKTVYPAYGNSYTVEVTEEEYNNHDNNLIMGTIQTAYKTMVSSIAQNGNKYRYDVSVAWTSMPAKRYYDIIGIGFNDYVYINSGVSFSYYYSTTSSTITSTDYISKKSDTLGGAAVYQLPSGSIVGLGANLYYDVSKDTSNTITSLTMCGDYAHATSYVTASQVANNYGITGGGISLGASIINKFDSMPCAYSTASVNW